MQRTQLPLLTRGVLDAMLAARRAGAATAHCSLDLSRSTEIVELTATHWTWREQRYPYPDSCKERTIYHWTGTDFRPVSRYSTSLIKLVPTEWGAPTFEIDGIKMLPTAHVSPYVDAERKVALVQPRGKRLLDTCGGLGYFAAWCLEGHAAKIESYEKNPDVLWLRSLNPWSPPPSEALSVVQMDVTHAIASLPDRAFAAVLHDPPRFGTAGELYSQLFYTELARVLERKGVLFHYTGSPNKLTSGRNVPQEVMRRLSLAGFLPRQIGDGVLAVKR